MYRHLFSLLTTIFLAIGITSCEDDTWTPSELTDAGKLNLKSLVINLDRETANVDYSGYTVEIIRGDVVEGSWTYALMPETVDLSAGEYTLTVSSPAPEVAEWDRPYYKASQTIKIEKGETAEAGAMTCKMQSVAVSLKFDDNLAPAMSDDCLVRVEAGNAGVSLDFDPSHYQSTACFNAIDGATTVVATFSGTVNGEYFELKPLIYTDVEAGKHCVVELNAEMFVPEEPEEPEIGISIECATLSFDSPNDLNAETLPEGRVLLHADNGIAHLKVRIESTNEDFTMAVSELLALEFDLAYPEEAGLEAEVLKEGLGFPVGEEVIGQTDVVFDITDFIPLLAAFDGEHRFVITIEDKAEPSHTLSKTLTFVK